MIQASRSAKPRTRSSVVVALVALFVAGDLLVAAEALANLGRPRTAAPVWREASTPTLLARRRVRRAKRRPPPPKKRTPVKQKPEDVAEPEAQAPEPPAPAGGPPPAADALQRGARVEFDGRLVQGQMAKSGAIYLFARKRADLRSMVKERTSYRREILRTVYPQSN